MELKTQISTSEWGDYQRELLSGFRKAGVSHRTIKEVKVIMSKIDWRFARICNEQVNYRQDHKDIHDEKIARYRQEADELVKILNENFVLEILLGD